MPNVLCIAYLFPPRAGVGVQRITKFVRYLPDHGWRPIVLTVSKPHGSFPLDYSYLREIPKSVIVEKAPSLEPYHFYRMLGGRKRQDSADFRQTLDGGGNLGFGGKIYSALQSAFLIPDPKIGWFLPAMKKAREIFRKYKIDLILSTSPEATDHVIARALARELKVPWVMDFRDPWTTSLYSIKRPYWAKRKEEELELSCLIEASAISVVQPRYMDEYIDKYPILDSHSDKFHVLPNGFDPGDIEKIDPRKFSRWTLVYTGSISYPRNPEPFLRGWKLACEKSSEFKNNAGCLFMGEFNSRFHEMAPGFIAQGLETEGFKERGDVYSAQLGSGALLLLSEGYVTGKAYEYLAAKKPILAITDGTDLAELVLRSRSGAVISPSKINKIADTLITLYENRNVSFEPDKDFLAKYDRRKITADLASIFNGLTNRKRKESSRAESG
ncbi:MAG TPA: glycosyltransferase [bacterium]|jgi:glycosyltransferase involved in cell wall biosynthesis